MKRLLMMGAVAGAIAAGATTTVLPYGDVRLKGPMGERLNKMIEHHLKATDVDYITAPFLEKTERGRRWQTEFWGKFMHAAMPFWTYTQDAELRKHIDFGFERICASQEPSGYIGNYPDELRCGEGWDVWGMKSTSSARTASAATTCGSPATGAASRARPSSSPSCGSTTARRTGSTSTSPRTS